MHNWLFGTAGTKRLDHINRNKTDNRKLNIRIVTNNLNGFNTDLQINNTSGTTGVSYMKNINRWIAYIKYNYEHIYLGCFSKYDDAVIARRAAEMKYFGEHKNTSPPNSSCNIRHKKNKDKAVGVSWRKSRNKWQAYIGYNYKTYGLGYYDNQKDAILARKNAEKKLQYFKENFEETQDKDGVKSLRFPVFKELREIGKEVNHS